MGRVRQTLGRLARRVRPSLASSSQPAPTPRPTPPPGPTVLGTSALADLAAVQRACTPQGRPLLINHWATWCEGCVVELPLLVEVHQRWTERVDFVGVCWDRFQPLGSPADSVRDVHRMATGNGVAWKNLVFDGAPEALFTGLDMAVHTVPQTALLGPDGALLWFTETPLDPEEVAALEAALVVLLGEA